MRGFRGPATLAGILCLVASLAVSVVGAAPAGAVPSSWTVWASADTSPTLTNVLYGDACTSGGACTAVGNSTTVAGRAQTLVETWNGTAWATVPSADTGGALDNALYGVSCPTATRCMAVGSATSTTGYVQNLAEVGNGSTWTIVPTPDTSATFVNSLSAVSCATATACMAVGSAADFTGSVTLTESWNGSSWTLVPSPVVPGTLDASLNAVSCTAANACMAVGDYTASNGVLQTLTDLWNGSAWTVVASPDTTTSLANLLNGVTCSSSTACTAVGAGYAAGGSAYRTLTESWNGSAWTIVASPDLSAGDNELLGVACTGTASCTAVGYSTTATSLRQGLVETWDGSSWSAAANPQPGLYGNSLAGTACVGSACVAVGSQEPGAGVLQTLVESDLMAPILSALSTTTFTYGVPGSVQLSATGNPQPAFAISGAPAGVTVDPVTGLVSGAPTQAGTFVVTATASNGVGPAATGDFDIVVPGLTVTTTVLPAATRGAAYAVQLTVSGAGPLSLVWTKSGTLPRGLQLWRTGLLTGVVSAKVAPGTYPVKVTVVAGSGKVKEKAVATVDLTVR